MKRIKRILLFIIAATVLMCSGCQKKETAVEDQPAEEISVKT